MVGIFSACSKKDVPSPNPGTPNTLPVTFKKDSSVVDMTIQPAKNNQNLFEGKLNTGSLNGFNLTNIKVKFIKDGDAAMPKDYIRRIYAVVEGPASGAYTTEIKDSVNNEFSFNSFVRNFAQHQVGSVKIYADILASSTNGTGLEDNLSLEVQLSYTGYLGGGSSLEYFQTNPVVGHKTIFSTQPQPFSISSVADPSTPVSGLILHGEEKPGLSYGVKFSGASGTITEHKFILQGQASTAVTALKLFDTNNNFIAQGNVSNGLVSIVASDAISLGVEKKFIVKPVVSVSSGSLSNYDFNIVLDEVKGFSSITGEQKTDGTDRTGNSFRVLKALIEIKKVAVPTLVITNGVMDLYTVDITAINGDVALKELTYDILLNDQGINDTLSLKNFQILNGSGSDLTSQFRFTDASGAIDTFFSESDSKLRTTRISGTGETVIPMGTTLRLRFRATVDGFNHPSDGDGIAIIPVIDATSSVGLKYLNTGGLVNGNARLYSSASPSSSATSFYLIWSDMSSPNHNGQFVQTSNDWLGGKGVISNLTVNNFHQ